MILYIENPKDTIRKVLGLISEYSKVAGYKINTLHSYYSAIKKNVFESVLMRWMKLEPIIQSEVSQKNTNTVY